MKKIDMIGFRSGKLTVIEECGKYRQETKWLCKCDCGEIVLIPGYHLRKGLRTSCGKCTNIGDKMRKHGEYNTRLYHIWENMKRRCLSKTSTGYANYGGRRIGLCKEWMDFETFSEWANSSGYSDGLSIDRVNVNGNYEPGNCKWIEKKAQSLNKRNNRRILYNGKNLTIREWSDLTGIPYTTIRARLNYGWKDPEKILTR